MARPRIETIAAGFAILAAVVGATWTVAVRTDEAEKRALRREVDQLKAEIARRDSPGIERLGPPVPAKAPGVISAPEEADRGAQHGFRLAILTPNEGDEVDAFTTVTYQLTGALPNGVSIILFLQDPTGQYWSWGKLNPRQERRVQIGISRDSGLTFQIGLLATDQPFPQDDPRDELPRHIAYEYITVRRR